MSIVVRGAAVITAMLLCLGSLSMAAGAIPGGRGAGVRCRAGQQFLVTISGGLGIHITVTNVGDHPVENLSWTISLSGPTCIGSETSGYILVLEPGESFSVFLLVFGFGPGSLEVVVNGTAASADIWFVGPFVFGV